MKKISESEREGIIQELENGKSSYYWKILKAQIQEWKDQENRYLDRFKNGGLDAKDLELYNRGVDRLEYLNKFLEVNESLINFNRTILERMKAVAVETYKNVHSFVEDLAEKANIKE